MTVSGSTAIASATHELLLRYGNSAYSNLHMNFLQVKCELEAQRYVIYNDNSQTPCIYTAYSNVSAQLNNVINILAAHGFSTPSQPTTRHTANQNEVTALAIPEEPEAYDHDDYPDVSFWHETDWNAHSDKQRDAGNTVNKLSFLIDEDGNPVPEKRSKEMTEHAKQAWTQLYYHRLDPLSWKKKTEDARCYFSATMRAKFSEFRYCDGNWKLERFATVKYPDWTRNTREKGGLSRKSSLIQIFSFIILCQVHDHQNARQVAQPHTTD